jgi:hypothetical protein
MVIKANHEVLKKKMGEKLDFYKNKNNKFFLKCSKNSKKKIFM